MNKPFVLSSCANCEALRADLEAVATLLRIVHTASSVRRTGWVAYENRAAIKEALALPGVVALLKEKDA